MNSAVERRSATHSASRQRLEDRHDLHDPMIDDHSRRRAHRALCAPDRAAPRRCCSFTAISPTRRSGRTWLEFFAARGIPAYAVHLRGRAGSKPTGNRLGPRRRSTISSTTHPPSRGTSGRRAVVGHSMGGLDRAEARRARRRRRRGARSRPRRRAASASSRRASLFANSNTFRRSCGRASSMPGREDLARPRDESRAAGPAGCAARPDDSRQRPRRPRHVRHRRSGRRDARALSDARRSPPRTIVSFRRASSHASRGATARRSRRCHNTATWSSSSRDGSSSPTASTVDRRASELAIRRMTSAADIFSQWPPPTISSPSTCASARCSTPSRFPKRASRRSSS